MSAPLIENPPIKCSHSGLAVLPPKPPLTVHGKRVLVKADIQAATGFVGYTNIPPPSGRVPCSAVTSVTVGSETSALTIAGKGAVLTSATAVTNSTPVAGSMTGIDGTQDALTAV